MLAPRWLGPLTLSALSGCATVVPLQTASTVPKGVLQVGGQGTITPYCTGTLNPANCALLPDGFPLPELGASVRHGVFPGVDVGAAARTNAVLGDDQGGLQAGLLADAKAEVFSAPAGEGARHLLSIGAGLGSNWQSPSGRDWRYQDGSFGPRSLPDLWQIDLVVPVFYGFQSGRGETVVSPRLRERITFEPSGSVATTRVTWAGLAVGHFRATEGGDRLGLQLGYEAPTAYFGDGVWTLTAGALFRLGEPQSP